VPALGLVLLFAECSCTKRPPARVPQPIRASPARKAEIVQAADKVRPGMTLVEVEQLMGKPDEERPLFESVLKNPKQIGTTRWYIVEGSIDDLSNSKAVRVSFDLEDRVTSVDRLDGVDSGPAAP
jgi:hypothetical protein